jgi:hypothetical protein
LRKDGSLEVTKESGELNFYTEGNSHALKEHETIYVEAPRGSDGAQDNSYESVLPKGDPRFWAKLEARKKTSGGRKSP